MADELKGEGFMEFGVTDKDRQRNLLKDLERCRTDPWAFASGGSEHQAAIRLAIEAQAEVKRLRAAFEEWHSQHGDDLCHVDDDLLCERFDMPPRDNRVGDKEAMLANCKRFVEHRCDGGGPWVSYAELEAERDRLQGDVRRLRELNETAEASLALVKGLLPRT